jgi:hypothetical protein
MLLQKKKKKKKKCKKKINKMIIYLFLRLNQNTFQYIRTLLKA